MRCNDPGLRFHNGWKLRIGCSSFFLMRVTVNCSFLLGSTVDSMRTCPAERMESRLALKFSSKKFGSRYLISDIQIALNELSNSVAAYRFWSAFTLRLMFNISNNASGQIQSIALLFEIYQGSRKLKSFPLWENSILNQFVFN